MSKVAMIPAAGALGMLALARDSEVPSDRMQRDLVFEVREGAVDEDARTIELSFSSEEPYLRWWGNEVLDHKSSSVRLGRLNDGGALLMDHNHRDQVGVVERAWIKGGKGFAKVRFGKSARAEEIWQDVKDGIRKLVSVGYRIHELVLEKSKDGVETYRATDWEPHEISIVAVPADTTVGVGRNGEPAGFDPRTLIVEEEEEMPMTRNAGAVAPTVSAAVAAPVAAPAAAPVVEARSIETVPATAAAQTINADDVRRLERERISNIRAMGTRLNCADLAETAISDGRSLEQFVLDYQARAGNASAIRVAESAEIGLTEREERNYSFLRLLNALANPNDRRAQEDAGFELECSAAARRLSNTTDHRGYTVPIDVLRSAVGASILARDLTVGTATAGGHTVATELLAGSFIDMLRNSMALTGMGIRTLTDLSGNLAIPRQTGGATAYWVAESGAPTESQQAFDQVALSPKTVGAFTDVSRRLLIQSSIDVEAFVRMDLATVLALEIDRVGIVGTGSSNQPRGILATSGIGSVAGGTNGAAPTFDHMVDLETAVSVANANVGNLGYLTNTKVRGKLKKTLEASAAGSDKVWARDNTINGYGASVSNQVPANLDKGSATGVCSAIIYGNWADLIMGMWSGLDLMVDPYTQSTSGTVRIVALQDVDYACRQPASFAAMLDALTT